MSAVFASIGTSLDGSIAGPNARPGTPLADDGLEIRLAPVLLGSGKRLLDGVDPAPRLTPDRTVATPEVTPIRYRVARGADPARR
ncbi:hypothetical protein ABZX75_11295 [Streptomyces sp. NPDC003038]|uniref:hypothetical protein n=1 Tax=unclassified Streptomyces TaxID=2593676 RepID=UPI0033BC7779